MERERPDTAAGTGAKPTRAGESVAERDRLRGRPGTPDRPAALDDEATGQSLTPERWAEIRLAIDRALDERRILDLRRRRRAAVRRHLATMGALRPVAVAAIGPAALLPFVVHGWGDGGGPGGALAAFAAAAAASGRGAAGLALAALCAGVLARRAARAGSVEGLAEPVVYAFLGGMAGLALARSTLGL